jgi:tetratricopeptide (TPR) repeat protein
LAQLWQAPLLLLSIGLFAYAAWLFIDPQPGLTLEQKVGIARTYLKTDRPEASIEQLNRLLSTEKLDRLQEGQIHLMLAEALDQGQKQKRISIPANYLRIIEQTQLALGQGVKPSADMYRRLGESFEALERTSEALANYRQAMTMDPSRSLPLEKKVIELQIATGELGAADASIEEYLKSKEISDAERAWALGERAQMLIDREKYAEAKNLLAESLRLSSDPVNQGAVNYRLGYCAWKMGEAEEADRLLRVAREQLRAQHPLDADACYVLGRIAQEQNKPLEANSFYQIVLVSHPNAAVAPGALLGRGVCRIMAGEDEAGMVDLHELTNQINAKPARAKLKPEALTGMNQAVTLLAGKGKYENALEVMADELALDDKPEGSFYARLAGLYEKRADQLDATIVDAPDAEKLKRSRQVRDDLSKAGDACLAYSKAMTLKDDKGYGQALWKGIGLYDRAGDLQRVISSLELFVAERPDDALAPDALLRLGQAYQAAGMFDKAIDAYQRNALRYPRSLAASKSAVPLAQAYIAKGPDFFSKAETVLLSVFDNKALTPEAEEFKQSLLELAQLYYRTGRYEEAVTRLEEWTQRYPKEPRLARLVFLMADSYRKSAMLLANASTAGGQLASAAQGQAATIAAASAAGDQAEAARARRERLTKAKALFDRSIDLYRATPPTQDVDKLYMKLSHFYRADCLYDLGQYEEAIKLYDAAAFRYQEDPSALAAYVQIVNSYCALGKMEEAKTANERAKWLLRRMPAETFEDGGFSMPKTYWEQWLKWTSKAGMWN